MLHIHRKLRVQQVAHMPDGGFYGKSFAQETTHRACFGRRFNNNQFPFSIVTLLRSDHPFVGWRFAHTEESGITNRALASRSRRSIGRKNRLWISYFPFCPTFYTICFQSKPPGFLTNNSYF